MSEYRLIEESPEVKRRAQEEWEREILAARERRDRDHQAGIPALHRLFAIANGDSGQCRKVAAFLLGLYNGQRFPFDLTDCRSVDQSIFDDMLLVLRMDSHLRQEVHNYVAGTGQAFEQLAQDWNLYKREWEPAGNGFTRRRGAYRLDIEAGVRGTSVMWTWVVSRWGGEGEQVASAAAWSADQAKQDIDAWFDRGGESPCEDK
ncbi:hypothetical protein CJO80_27165 (plasmid) [Ralstonia solanacearum]|nr:hypothetical protein CJO80_27165 [Ralstonia solanacearum]